MDHILFIHSWVDGHWVISILGLLSIMLLWTFICQFGADICFRFSWVCRCGTAGSYANFTFNFFWGTARLFQSSCTILHSHQQCLRSPIYLCPWQHLFLPVFLILAILVGVKWYLVVLICISLMANDVEHLFMCLLAICASSLEKYLLR